jgi:hypothetical protein
MRSMRKGVLVLDTYVSPGLGGIDYDKKVFHRSRTKMLLAFGRPILI